MAVRSVLGGARRRSAGGECAPRSSHSIRPVIYAAADNMTKQSLTKRRHYDFSECGTEKIHRNGFFLLFLPAPPPTGCTDAYVIFCRFDGTISYDNYMRADCVE